MSRVEMVANICRNRLPINIVPSKNKKEYESNYDLSDEPLILTRSNKQINDDSIFRIIDTDSKQDKEMLASYGLVPLGWD